MQEVNDLVKVVNAEPGYAIELFGLHLYRLENGDFVVEYENHKTGKEFYKEFKNAYDAAICFEKKRKEWKIGFDFDLVK